MVWPYFGKRKSDLYESVEEFKKNVVDKSKFRWRQLQSDDENVINMGDVSNLLREMNGEIRSSAPYVHSQNGYWEEIVV